MITVDPFIVTLIVGPLLTPLITALLTKAQASLRVKVAVNAVVAFFVAFVAASIVPETGTAVFSLETLGAAVMTFLSSSVFYDKVFKPFLGIDVKFAPAFGIGSAEPDVDVYPLDRTA